MSSCQCSFVAANHNVALSPGAATPFTEYKVAQKSGNFCILYAFATNNFINIVPMCSTEFICSSVCISHLQTIKASEPGSASTIAPL